MWQVEFCDEFAEEFLELKDDEQDAIAQRLILLKMKGPHLARPYADTLYGSKHSNMKELRFDIKTRFGGWLTLLIRKGGPSFLLPAIKPAKTSAVSMSS
jgi:Phage derived protein Gp49-like (DUF891)